MSSESSERIESLREHIGDKREQNRIINNLLTKSLKCRRCMQPLSVDNVCVTPKCRDYNEKIPIGVIIDYNDKLTDFLYNSNYRCLECKNLLYSNLDLKFHARITGFMLHATQFSDHELYCIKCHRPFSKSLFEFDILKRKIKELEKKRIEDHEVIVDLKDKVSRILEILKKKDKRIKMELKD